RRPRRLRVPLLADGPAAWPHARDAAAPRAGAHRLRAAGGAGVSRTWLLLLGAAATVGFAAVVLVGIPRVMLVRVAAPPGLAPYTALEARGRAVYIANGCVYCHSQQLRDPAFTTDLELGWGSRADVPADYVHDRPHLLGTMRTGPDLINVGERLPSADWHLIHLYNPRALVRWSIMPSFPYLFEEKERGDVGPGDVVVRVQPPY